MLSATSISRQAMLIWGVILSAAVALLLGFIIPSQATSASWFRHGSYYILLAGFILWLLSLPPERIIRSRMSDLARRNALPFGLAVVIIAAAWQSSPPSFRVLADETNLMGTALSMYEDRQVTNIHEALFYLEGFDPILRFPDIRPAFFPFLVTVAHAVLGYSAYNGFVVNAIAGVFALFCFYLFLARWFSPQTSLLGMLLLASFPTFVLWVTSSGFEIVNLLFVILAFLFLDRYLQTGRGRHAERLGLTLVLLAQIRYESALFLLLLIPVGIRFFRQRDLTGIRGRMAVLPLLLLPVAWQRMSMKTEAAYQVSDGYSLFSTASLLKNLNGAWQFFAESSASGGTLPAVFFLAVIGAGWAVLHVARSIVRSPRLSARARILFSTVAGVYGILAIVTLAYAWGDFTKPYTGRLAIVFLPVIVGLALFPLHRLVSHNRTAAGLCFGGALALLLLHWPIAGRAEPIRELKLYRDYRTVQRVIKSHYMNENIVVVTTRPSLYTPHRWGALSIATANGEQRDLLRNLKQGLFQEAVVIQHIQYSNSQPEHGSALVEGYQLETLYEEQSTAALMLRISRVVH